MHEPNKFIFPPSSIWETLEEVKKVSESKKDIAELIGALLKKWITLKSEGIEESERNEEETKVLDFIVTIVDLHKPLQKK